METVKDMSSQFKNWGPFFDEVLALEADITLKRTKETNPYRQYSLDEQIKTANAVQYLYRAYLKKGLREDLSSNVQGVNLGKGFLSDLDKLVESLRESAAKETKDYMQSAYRSKINLVKKIRSLFVNYILKP